MPLQVSLQEAHTNEHAFEWWRKGKTFAVVKGTLFVLLLNHGFILCGSFSVLDDSLTLRNLQVLLNCFTTKVFPATFILKSWTKLEEQRYFGIDEKSEHYAINQGNRRSWKVVTQKTNTWDNRLVGEKLAYVGIKREYNQRVTKSARWENVTWKYGTCI